MYLQYFDHQCIIVFNPKTTYVAPRAYNLCDSTVQKEASGQNCQTEERDQTKVNMVISHWKEALSLSLVGGKHLLGFGGDMGCTGDDK